MTSQRWTSLARSACVVAMVAACGAAAACSTAPPSQAAGSTAASAMDMGTMNMGSGNQTGCDPAIMVNINHDSYDRTTVNLNEGDTLLVMNHTQDTFTLTTKPDDGLRYMVVDPNEMEHVPFTKPGTIVLGSREHPTTTMIVHVSSTKSYTCGERPVATITFGRNHTFSPDTATVDEGQSILVIDAAGTKLHMVSTPDLGPGMGHQLYNAGEQQTLLFPDNGKYVFSPTEFPAAKLSVTVTDTKSN